MHDAYYAVKHEGDYTLRKERFRREIAGALGQRVTRGKGGRPKRR